MKKLLTKLTLCTILLISSLSAQEYIFPSLSNNQTAIGALNQDFSLSAIAGNTTLKQHSVDQKGWLYGVKGNLNIYLNSCIYLGTEIGYQYGDLKGHSEIEEVTIVLDEVFVEDSVKSKYKDYWLEGRIGAKLGTNAAFLTPYFVVGYENETDNFISPSPLELKNSLSYGYLGCGGLSSFFVTPCFSIGLNAKLKWMFNSKVKVSGHADLEDKNFSCANCFHYTVELPLTFFSTPNSFFAVVPYYQYKNYDKHNLHLIGHEKATFSMWATLLTFGMAF